MTSLVLSEMLGDREDSYKALSSREEDKTQIIYTLHVKTNSSSSSSVRQLGVTLLHNTLEKEADIVDFQGGRKVACPAIDVNAR
ncbi:hypothetical protein TREES_T100002786 [Tupaia chinensis]|uniref:Uncharacterized protein n=1 Tax=Tupaia chinensis TaxID=246437 RepID=L9KYB3_TUPCH|nr:hypothetical protein TREES_T100002786 [Tupaia chinensis]